MAENYKITEEELNSVRGAALRGDAESQNYLGMLYFGGVNVKKDEKRAFELFMEAAKQDNAEGAMNVADCYENGNGVKQNYEQALKWYQKAADLGNAEAMAAVGLFYEFGHVVAKDTEKAVQFYKKAIAGGNVSVNYHLGRYYRAKGDSENAFKCFLIGAENGITESQYEVARYYEHGWGTPVDDMEALNWYVKAMAAGYDKAQYELGNRYFEGRGVEKDLELAARLFAAASQQGHMQATLNLEKCQKAGVDFQKLIDEENRAREEEEAAKAEALRMAEEASRAGMTDECAVGIKFRKEYEQQHNKN